MTGRHVSFFLSEGKKKKSKKTWKRQRVGDNPHSQWIICNSCFSQFQDFLKLNPQSLNPHYTVKECVSASTLLLTGSTDAGWPEKSEITGALGADTRASACCRGAVLNRGKDQPLPPLTAVTDHWKETLFISTAGLENPVLQYNKLIQFFFFFQQLRIFIQDLKCIYLWLRLKKIIFTYVQRGVQGQTQHP